MGKGQWGGSLVPTAEGMGTGDGSWENDGSCAGSAGSERFVTVSTF